MSKVGKRALFSLLAVWFLLAVGLFVLTVVNASASTFEGKVVKVVDGDTIDVLLDGNLTRRVRLAEIDTPELRGQPFGRKAKQATLELAAGKYVVVEGRGEDRYERTIGEVFLPDGRSLNQELVRLGLAWQYRRYSNDRGLTVLEEEARTAKRGLWSDPKPVPPWEWRRR